MVTFDQSTLKEPCHVIVNICLDLELRFLVNSKKKGVTKHLIFRLVFKPRTPQELTVRRYFMLNKIVGLSKAATAQL